MALSDVITVKAAGHDQAANPLVKVENERTSLAPADESRGECDVRHDARTVANGERVTKGFERKLTLVGVGYRAQAQATS